MNTEKLKEKMDRWVAVRKLLARLDREIFGVRTTLKELELAMGNENTFNCTIEPTEDCCEVEA